MENIFVPFNRFAPAPIFLDPIDVVQDPYAPEPLPPVYSPPIKDYNPPPADNGGAVGPGRDPALRSYNYTGQVRDAYSLQSLPGATVQLLDSGAILMQQVADGNGNFNITLNMPATTIAITEVSHKSFSWPASEVQHSFDLEPDEKQIDPVLLPPGTKKQSYAWVVLLGAAFFIAKEEKLI